MFGIEVDVLSKSQEHRLNIAMEKIEMRHEEWLKCHVENFQYEVKKLHEVAKERHTIFVKEVQKVEQSVTLKFESLKSELSKEVT